MTVIVPERSVDHREDDRGGSSWLDIGGPAARTVLVGSEFGSTQFGGDQFGSDHFGVERFGGSTSDEVLIPRLVRPTVRHRPLRRARAGSGVACAGADRPTVHGARLTRRGRMVVAVAWLALVIIAAVPIVGAVGTDAVPASTTVTITVTDGDTLWDIARVANPEDDPRETVTAIVELNDLDSAAGVRAGDRLVVPTAP